MERRIVEGLDFWTMYRFNKEASNQDPPLGVSADNKFQPE